MSETMEIILWSNHQTSAFAGSRWQCLPDKSPLPDTQPTTMSMNYPLETELHNRKTPITGVVEKRHGKTHEVFQGAPCEWSALYGATHTLYCGELEGLYRRPHTGTRPAKLLKTVLYVGIDEADGGGIVWEKWGIKTQYVFPNN